MVLPARRGDQSGCLCPSGAVDPSSDATLCGSGFLACGLASSVNRKDGHEEVFSDPQSFLFQRTVAGQHRMWTDASIGRLLTRLVQAAGLTTPDGQVPKVTPHDLRRMFATRAVNTGLPVHIVAQLLGHRSLETTRGCIASFTEESFAAYQAWVAGRRAQRPPDEYRPPTPDELAQVDPYLLDRKVQGGTCTRTFGQPCTHQHNCKRCPLVSLDPAARPDVDDQTADARARLAQAEANGWTAEAEGHRLDLDALAGKQADLDLRDAAATGLPLAPDPFSDPGRD